MLSLVKLVFDSFVPRDWVEWDGKRQKKIEKKKKKIAKKQKKSNETSS